MLYFIRQALQPIIAIVMAIIMMFSAAGPEKAPEEFEQVQNVIYLIGDGMGPLHLEKAKQERNITLTMDTFDYIGRSQTRSQANPVTDSAAGATALACGVRTFNGYVGVFYYDPLHVESQPKSLTELCIEKGMMTGIVTTDSTSGATPSGFSVHTSSRNNTEDIDTQQMNSDIDLIWGGTSDYISQETCEANGFTFVKTYSEMMAVEEGERSFAQFDNNTWGVEQYDAETPTLSQMAMKAIDVLDDTDEGFFIMIEGAHIDKHSHSNLDAEMAEALEEFDRTVAAALDYAEKDGNTLVVVTADHETGGIVLNDDGTYSFTSGSHSGANVPVLVYGSDTFLEDGEVVNNIDIPVRIAYSLGFEEGDIPYEQFADWMKYVIEAYEKK
ncbi:MAG: alkaline phosphatase [Clostridia bacterium]|nr:alkaline phosphatase [Clostridia bacterium]